ncbi:MAG: alpha-mannosidase [Candidatus Eremiobacteraeota bacterium]|nr:alpha-mannosidase [Candidatus Eremiobacteraeota bacterium]
MRLPLKVRGEADGVVRLTGVLNGAAGPAALHYATHTGALVRIGGRIAGAFDREHGCVIADVEPGAEVEIEVERRSLPSSGLPSGPGVRWRWMNAQASQAPARQLDVNVAPATSNPENGPLPLIGHAHLDVAWLWTYAESARKALRTFATAVALLERNPRFVFSMSQPQLYRFVERLDPEFFERIRSLVRDQRFDAGIAALWVESDCNLPSGESLLRQMLHAHAFCMEEFGVTPHVAWLPDTFGFPNTLPTLLAHAGIPYFATTKLNWNDTTRFPYLQFRWRGPDGSDAIGALLAAYEGRVDEGRAARATERREPLVAGFGDGGGGVTQEMIDAGAGVGKWTSVETWFGDLEKRREKLPAFAGELYLEYHRGTYTTHHDVKAANARLERGLTEAEELVAWCIAVGARKELVTPLAARLRETWEVVLRNQFHDVLPGTSTGAVYADVRDELETAQRWCDEIVAAARAVLPRGRAVVARPVEPRADGAFLRFESERLVARFDQRGALVEAVAGASRNAVARGNLLLFYRDRPREWEAWNLDASYAKRMRRARVGRPQINDAVVTVPLRIGKSSLEMRIKAFEGEPFVRVALECDWRERRTLLRVENWLAVETDAVLYGAPHGTIERTARVSTAAERAMFEVPGQRFAFARDSTGNGLAVLARDTYGWNARLLPRGGIVLGHSLLRGTTWPDPDADRGAQLVEYAFAPRASRDAGTLERVWETFAGAPRVRLFSSDDSAVLVVACKPAWNGDGVVVRIRECDGDERVARIRCAGRVRSVESVDALERPDGAVARFEGDAIVAALRPFALRSFRVRF